ncbi:hypothetical protein APHAL10511_004950 [Amanita phalloides]|nr:hypothetical protein APHAL10511_004950 [Amanita phalloides]
MSSADPLLDSAPSFADTLREQDELFYAVFPQARSEEYCIDFRIGNNSSYVLSLTNVTCEPRHSPSQISQLMTYHQTRLNDSIDKFGCRGSVHLPAASDDVAQPHISDTTTFGPFGPLILNNTQDPSVVTQHPPRLFSVRTEFPMLQSEHLEGRRREQSQTPQQLQKDKLPIRSQTSKRIVDKKPALACLFCRGRKIACGPPVTGTKEKTCGQCQRRSLTCVYPSESRRGMRKKNVVDVPLAPAINMPEAND